jgi:hypothetical protein
VGKPEVYHGPAPEVQGDACLEVPDHGKPARRREVFFLTSPTRGKLTSEALRSGAILRSFVIAPCRPCKKGNRAEASGQLLPTSLP